MEGINMGKWINRLKKARDKIADFHDSVSNGAAKLAIPDEKMNELMNKSPFDNQPLRQTVPDKKLKKKVITEEYYE